MAIEDDDGSGGPHHRPEAPTPPRDDHTVNNEVSADEDAPSHLPFAPPELELLHEETTVDPSYVLSLIRKLLPQDMSGNQDSCIGKKGTGGENNANGDECLPVQAETSDPWEECGCILWDLSASKTHAEFLIENLILEVLLANLHVTQSPRVKEICIGIIGNLACHETLTNTISSHDGLIVTVINQLYLDDTSCLTEIFRLLSAALRGSGYHCWVEVLHSDELLSRILWIVENTLNATLFEKAIEFFLAVTNNPEIVNTILQPLINLGLMELLVDLLTCEAEKIANKTKLERVANLILVLQVVEELSTIGCCTQLMSSNKVLLQRVSGIIKYPDKFEVACCGSAIIIMANLLTEEHLLSTFSHDFPFMEGLFENLQQVIEDSDARDALWCLLGRLLTFLRKDKVSSTFLGQLAPLIMGKFDCIQAEVAKLPLCESYGSADATYLKHGISASLRGISSLMEQWITEKSSASADDAPADGMISEARKVIAYCENWL